jgi:hypothetical protein
MPTPTPTPRLCCSTRDVPRRNDIGMAGRHGAARIRCLVARDSTRSRGARPDRGRLVRVFAIDLVPALVRTGRAHEEVERSRPKPSHCRIAYNRRTRKSSKEIREAVSDRG